MLGLLQGVERRLLDVARRAGIKLFAALVAALLVAVGGAFVIFALWVAAVGAWGPIIGSLVLGAGFLFLGALTFGIGTLKRPPPPPPVARANDQANVGALVEAFVLGMKAGKDVGKDKKD